MSCCVKNLKKCNYKSIQRAFNNNSQTLSETGTTLNLLGTLATDTGLSITTNTNNFTINCNGSYRIECDVTFESTLAGTVIVQLYKNGVALPCAIASSSTSATDIYTLHVETDLYLKEDDVISVNVSGISGNATWIGATCEKLA